MASLGLLGALGGAGEGASQVGGILLKDQLEGFRQEKMADLQGERDESQNKFKASEGKLNRESAERIAGNKIKSKGSSKWNEANGMSLMKRQEKAKKVITEIMAGNAEYATMPEEQLSDFKSKIYTEYGLDSIGENIIDRNNIKTPEQTDIGLLGTDDGQAALVQSEKESRSKMGIKDYIPFVEPDEEEIRKNALKMLGRGADESGAVQNSQPAVGSAGAPDPSKYAKVNYTKEVPVDGSYNDGKVIVQNGIVYKLK